MELWIRSQDKMKLVKVNSINILDNGLTFHGYINDKDNFWLGNYKSKERALEVLDEIQNLMLKGAFAKKENGLGEVLDYIPNNLIIYAMPKE